jgi:NodT family efflux transporter outer membrane factor (OMF) lipoprotein
MKLFKMFAAGFVFLFLAGCEVGPDYAPPAIEAPAIFKEGATWQPAKPDDAVDRGMWWSVYKDPVLDDLEKQIDISNQNLKAAEAAYRQATALVDQTRAGFFPTLSVNGGATATGTINGQSRGGSTATTTSSSSTTATSVSTGRSGSSTTLQYNASADLSWTLDIWGRIRRTLEANEASAEVSAADLASARLSAQATLASTYFQLRVQDDLKQLLSQTVANDQNILKIIQNQLQVGVAAQADVLSAQTQLESVQASLINADVARAQYEHAIAVLIGKPPSEFSLPARASAYHIPKVPAEIPSVVLQRRPDVAAAERQVASANAEIGVATAAYYPDLTISGSFQSIASQIGQLLKASNMVWSVGPALAETVIDFGARDAQVDQARAAYDQTVANYRQTVLTAFQNVEDNLAGERILAQQADIEDKTVADARASERLTLNQYKAGIIPYNTVLVAQSTTLSNEQTALNVTLSRLTTSVGLIQSLGGGWDVAKLQDPIAPVAETSASAPVDVMPPAAKPETAVITTPQMSSPAIVAPNVTAPVVAAPAVAAPEPAVMTITPAPDKPSTGLTVTPDYPGAMPFPDGVPDAPKLMPPASATP